MSEERSANPIRFGHDETTSLSFDAGKLPQASGDFGSDLSAVPMVIGRYQVERRLGRGGFGTVYLAFDERLDRRVAVKVPHLDLTSLPNAAEAYLAEARTVANLDHPNIVPVYDFGSSDSHPCFIVMKYVNGSDFQHLIKQRTIDKIEIAGLIATVATALHHAHKQGFVHRDLKPSNILIDESRNPWVVDFGLALREQDIGTGPRFAGTASYMSPEQARGEGHRVDGRSDIYSLGAILFELLTGVRPVNGKTKSELLEQVMFQDVRPLRQLDASIPRELERICLKSLSKRASERYATAIEMADDLQHFIVTERLSVVASSNTMVPSSEATGTHPTHDSSRSGSDVSQESQTICVVPKGLRSFESHDSDFFLTLLPGPRDRDAMPDSLRFWKQKLEDHDNQSTFSVGVMYGPSGCGKSSLVKAGLVPHLSPDVIPIMVEASDRTVDDLYHQCSSRWPSIAASSLPEFLSSLRQGEGPSLGRKIVLILDQFEQWLHSTTDYTRSELVQSLRQCDGGRLQCLLLVRDDFWLPVSRFMRSLEVKLVEGHNSALVDLFDKEHAQRVLAAFGRAYGRLPSRVRDTTDDQRKFLQAAVESLAESGRVISVRLALFAEMMKDRPWTSASLESCGGTHGIGVAFLEHNFADSTAPPEHRYHQQAASAVLKSLLPDVGIDIKGEMKSLKSLLQASGYENRYDDFLDLIRILDSKVRLIAPTDPSAKSLSTSAKTSHEATEQYYQLTHDYLVQPLRDWLTSKQRNSRRGRAELCLAERTAIWSPKSESRLLPSIWEWASIHVLTSRHRWTNSQRMMMNQMNRFVASRAIMWAVILIFIAVVGWEMNGQRHSRVLMDNLLHAPSRAVPAIVSQMRPYRRWINPLLMSEMRKAESEPQRLHLKLAAPLYDAAHLKDLISHSTYSTPEELLSIRLCTLKHSDALIPELWKSVTAEGVDAGKQLRLACLLAAFAPEDNRWDQISKNVLMTVESENTMLLRQWTDLLSPARSRLLPALAIMIADSSGVSEQRPLSDLYVEFASDIPNAYLPLMDILNATTSPINSPSLSDQSRIVEVARRKANIAATLAIAGKWDVVLPLLISSPDPTLRTVLIERLGASESLTPELARQLTAQQDLDESIIQAIALALGDLASDRTSVRLRETWLPVMVKWANDNDSARVQSSIGWTLRRWANEGNLPSGYDAMTAIPDPKMIRYVKVDPHEISFQDQSGQSKSIRINYPFEIGVTEVTIFEYQQFREEFNWDRRAAPTEDCPVHEVTWFDAAAYCNWLSKQAGIPQDQWCYFPNQDGAYADGMSIPGDSLSRSGYRLATTDEWEMACRGRCETYWSIGQDVELLDRYAWSLSNSGIHSHPVASLRPNDLGLFDMHGNVWEWCHNIVDELGRSIAHDTSEIRYVTNETFIAMRGGTYLTDPQSLGTSSGNWNVASKRTNADGFRVARTLTSAHQRNASND